MANGQVAVTFDGVNLDNCIKQGLKLTGYAKCPYCKQIFTYQLHLHKNVNTRIAGETVTSTVDDGYDISIDFSGDCDPLEVLYFLGEPDKKQVDLPCVPCNGCTPNCERLANR